MERLGTKKGTFPRGLGFRLRGRIHLSLSVKTFCDNMSIVPTLCLGFSEPAYPPWKEWPIFTTQYPDEQESFKDVESLYRIWIGSDDSIRQIVSHDNKYAKTIFDAFGLIHSICQKSRECRISSFSDVIHKMKQEPSHITSMHFF